MLLPGAAAPGDPLVKELRKACVADLDALFLKGEAVSLCGTYDGPSSLARRRARGLRRPAEHGVEGARSSAPTAP
jgi:hypothetical protein